MSDLVNPNDYGVLPTGFSRMRLPEIRQAIITSLQTTTGLTFETRTDSITGQFIDVFAEREATLWELAEAVYHAMYPISAYGVNLDHAVSFAGVRRLFPQTSNVWCILYGQETTLIAAGAMVRSNINQETFILQNDVTISRQVCIDFTVAIDYAIVGNDYWIRIDAALFTYHAVGGDTTLTIANNLYTQLLASNLVMTLDANQISGHKIESVPFNLQISTDIRLVEIGSIGNFNAENFGPISVAANTVTQIISTQTGWEEVNNIVDGAIGRNLETDEELRLRYDTGVFRIGAATLPSIKANLEQNIVGIQNVEVFENEDDVTDSDGRPPHSIEVVAYGGDPQEIGNQIWLTKAAGIDTYGSVSITITDSTGYAHIINFNRPTPIFAWVNVTIDLYDEEIFPDTGVQQIQAVVVQTGNNFGIGKDIIIQRFLGPIYANVPGIANVTITVAITSDPNTVPSPGAYGSANIAISSRELSQFDLTRVSVTITP